MKNKQIFFIVLFLIFTCINGLKLKKNIKMIEEAKKEMSSLIKDAIKDAKREIKEEKKINYK